MIVFFSGDDFATQAIPELYDGFPGMVSYFNVEKRKKPIFGRFKEHMAKKKRQRKEGPEKVSIMFLDSGAHSLYGKEVLSKGGSHPGGHPSPAELKKLYSFYETDAFWGYVDRYANYVKENIEGIDYYVNVDAIFNPELTWDVQQYMENEHGLNPVPVIHHGTDMKWIKHYVKRGHDLIGLGGLGQEVKADQYFRWADVVYEYLCPSKNNHLPIVRTHGFAMTAYNLLIRYPWWSVDSASWVKAGGFGSIYMPTMTNGKFDFVEAPTALSISATPPNPEKEDNQKLLALENDRALIKKQRLSNNAIQKGASYHNLPPKARDHVHKWLDEIEVPLGSVDENGDLVEWGVISHHAARKIANLKFFDRMCKFLPDWPWPYHRTSKKRKAFF